MGQVLLHLVLTGVVGHPERERERDKVLVMASRVWPAARVTDDWRYYMSRRSKEEQTHGNQPAVTHFIKLSLYLRMYPPLMLMLFSSETRNDGG